MDTMRNKEWEILKGYIYTGPSSLTFLEPLKPSKPFRYTRCNYFSSKKSGRGHFYHTLETNWFSYLEQRQAWFSSLWITKGSQRILSQLMPLPEQWAADTQNQFPAQILWPRGQWWQWCQQMEPKIIPGPGFLFKPYRDDCTGLSFVTNSSVVTPGSLLTQQCPQNPLTNIPLIFLEVCSRRILHQSSMSKKTRKHYQLS